MDQQANKIFYIVQYYTSGFVHSSASPNVEIFHSKWDIVEWYNNVYGYVKPSIVKIQEVIGTIKEINPIKKEIKSVTYETDWLGALYGQEPTNERMGRDTEIKERKQETKT